MAKQDNTLLNKVKSLVVRAWRERWNDIHWGIHFKKAVQSSPTGTDTRELAGEMIYYIPRGTDKMLFCSTYRIKMVKTPIDFKLCLQLCCCIKD